jgi:hypothetical protein
MATIESNDSVASRTRSKSKTISADEKDEQTYSINLATTLWDKLNNALEYAPKFQNKSIPGVDEETIQRIEAKLGITLPKEIRDVVKVHDGRDHINYGFSYRLATTDLLPIKKWRPYEKEGEGCSDALFECLTDENDRCANKKLCNDAKNHLKAYMNGVANAARQTNTNYELANDKAFHALPCELLIIGEGMDDYVEQYILSIRSGQIYLAVHNIPEWTLIGTFADWIEMGVESAVNNQKDIQEQNDDI